MYNLLRLAFLAWLVAPQTNGATVAYKSVRPFLLIVAEKVKQYAPIAEPYIKEFLAEATQQATAVAGAAVKASAAAEKKSDDSFAPLKTHAQ